MEAIFSGMFFAAGNVVEEELGLSAAADDIVDAHCNAVDTDSVVLIHYKSKLELWYLRRLFPKQEQGARCP